MPIKRKPVIKQKRQIASGRAQTQVDAIHRYFRNMPVMDARENLRIFVSDKDIKRARQKDPEKCVYANACRRQFGSHAILFFRTVAYIDLPDENGNWIVNRFLLNNDVKAKIVAFDRTGKAAKGGFLLSAPHPSKTMNAIKKAGTDYYARRVSGVPRNKARRKAYLKGRAVMAALGTDIRNGSGMVHFR